MKLLTKTIEKKFIKNPPYSQRDKGKDAEVIVKYFDPCGAGTWLITEAEKLENGDWWLYGYITLGYEWEWGPILLSELQAHRGRLGIGIERDLWCEGQTVKELSRN